MAEKLVSELSVILIFIVCIVQAQNFDCYENFCKGKENACRKIDCKDESIIKNATDCGCCDVCLKELKLDEECSPVFHTLKEGYLNVCGYGLICNKETKKCVEAHTNCLDKERNNKGITSDDTILPTFECDKFGYFKPFICIPGVLCHCVDKNGERIFGTDFQENNDTMECDCSREISDFKHSKRNVADEQLPRCLPNGNYYTLQRSDEMYFCMNNEDLPGIHSITVNESLKQLSCYNSKLHKDGLVTKCQQEREKEKEIFKTKDITAFIGVDLTRCDLDGSYYPVQCKKNKCYCVDRNGEPYNVNQPRNSEKAKQMTCRCLRDKEILADANEENENNGNIQLFRKLQCDDMGNYIKKQTVETKFILINENGI